MKQKKYTSGGRFFLVFIAATALTASCRKQDSNIADCDGGQAGVPCSEQTPDEKARRAMEDGDYSSAIEILEEAIAADPENYERFPLLGAAYAARAGFDILKASQGGMEAGGSLLESVGSFLPNAEELGEAGYDASLADMAASIDILKRIPEENITAEDADASEKSALLQLTLYQSAYSIMYLNKFAISTTTGDFDPSKLATMSEDDALVILESLAAAGDLQSGPEGEVLQAQINEALASIDEEDGTSKRDKLIAFASAQQQHETNSSSLNQTE